MQTQPILVIGATGKTGSRVAAQLEERGVSVRRGTRSAPIPFDWDAPDTWAPALDGVSRAYVTYFPDLAFPGAVEKVEALAAVAKDAGTERLVLLSGRGEHHARLGEEAVRASGVEFTLIRSAWFAQNFSEGYLRDPILAGVLPMPGGMIAEPIIDIDDIADVAVAALTEDHHAGELYEVTGPRLMTFADMAAELSKVIGRPIQHVPITFEDFHANVAEAGGDFVADVFTAIARETLDGRNAFVCDGVQRAIGRAPRDFAEYARAAAAAGQWPLDVPTSSALTAQ
ncbi:MAG: NmrA family NAD(P)-binding protein [Pseudomonadota bacterium]